MAREFQALLLTIVFFSGGWETDPTRYGWEFDSHFWRCCVYPVCIGSVWPKGGPQEGTDYIRMTAGNIPKDGPLCIEKLVYAEKLAHRSGRRCSAMRAATDADDHRLYTITVAQTPGSVRGATEASIDS